MSDDSGYLLGAVVVLLLAVASVGLPGVLSSNDLNPTVAAVAGVSGLAGLAVAHQLERPKAIATAGVAAAIGLIFPALVGFGVSWWAIAVTAVGIVAVSNFEEIPAGVISLGPLGLAAQAAAPGSSVVSGLLLSAAAYTLLVVPIAAPTIYVTNEDFEQPDSEPSYVPSHGALVPTGSVASDPTKDVDHHHVATTTTSPITLGDPPRASGLVSPVPASRPPYAQARSSDEYRSGTLHVLAHSRRGIAHVHGQDPRQDDYATATSEDERWLVVAVADGLGSADSSHIGAFWATRIAVDTASKRLGSQQPTRSFFEEVFAGVAEKMTWAANAVAQKKPNEIATTLVVAVIQTDTGQGFVGRVGDSDAMQRTAAGWTSAFGASLDGVSTVTHVMPRDAGQISVKPISVGVDSCLIVGTDGVCDVIAASADVVGRRFFEDLETPCSLEHFERLVGFERRAALDDRTLVAVWGGRS